MTQNPIGDYATLNEYQLALSRAVARYRNDCNDAKQTVDLSDPFLRGEWPSAYEFTEHIKCQHSFRHPVRYIISNGTERVALQCLACGHKLVNGIKKTDYPNFDSLPTVDEELIENARLALNEAREQMYEYFTYARSELETYRQELSELEKHSHDAEWWAKYTRYLNSPEWDDKRHRVLARDGYMCQACLKREATQAHHMTYARVFNEPLFDLISVCSVCHTALHPHMQEAAR